MEDAVQFRWDPRRLNWFTGLLALIGAPGVLLLGVADPGAKVFGAGWAAMFCAGCFALIKRRSDRDAVVTVSNIGIFDRRISSAVIPWSAVSRVEGFEAENVPFTGLDFHDAKTALAAAKLIVRLFAPLHSLMRFPAVSINMNLLDGTGADLHAAISRFRSELFHHA